MSEKQKDYFTTREAADALGVAVSTIQVWTNNGLLGAWLTGGGHRRIARTSVEEMLEQQQPESSDVQKGQKLSVVIVEDNEQQIRLYEKQLAVWGLNAHVVTAKNGYEGLIKIGRVLPDVIIADLMMPNLDGFQMLKALRDLPDLGHCEIIVVTGLTADEIEAKGGLPDGVHCFNKPVPFEKLEALLKKQSARIKAA